MERKQIKRSKIRLLLGRDYFTFKRYMDWYFSRKKYARTINRKDLQPYVVFTHRTPLIRNLKKVDMYLQYNKITNLKIAVSRVNGLILKPGETFSYWRIIGKPTYRKGYMDGMVLCPDGTFKPGVGGGLCQLSNLIYWMTLHTPLRVAERYRHSHDIFPDVNRTQPFGTGATCSYNYLDLQIQNDTNNIYQLVVYLTNDKLVGEWRCSQPSMSRYHVYEKEHAITAGIFGGYIRNNVIYRKVYNLQNELIRDEYITENHAYMTYSPFLNDKNQVSNI